MPGPRGTASPNREPSGVDARHMLRTRPPRSRRRRGRDVQRDLVERARRGDHDAFAVLAGATIGRLDAAARLILRDPDRAEDAVQETLVRCWRNLPSLRDVERFDAWLN